MSNETKRDVFVDAVDALADAQASGGNVGHQDANLFMAEYDNALPDDLPTIPLAVSEHIKQDYGKTTLFDELAWAFQDSFDSSEVNEWITNNEDIFAEAWSRGLWVVEETGEVTSYDG
ncbi:hypothetical protein [Lacticaseibacillus paracasei]|uniref:hypothetical protein n=1 Tax=Lacticaseibacillus paracasei TaxID=1597 RepID=UPI000FEE88A2|nr:hypothetical protein [Lacticaseibacillus paracasei]RND56401.1 hypothetical protein FAM18119_02000 [Lacticaseibacillus paracasei]